MSSHSDGLLRALQELIPEGRSIRWSRYRHLKLFCLVMVLVNAFMYIVIFNGHKQVITERQISTSKPRDVVVSTRDLRQVSCDRHTVIKDIVRHHGSKSRAQSEKLCGSATKRNATDTDSGSLFWKFLVWLVSGSRSSSSRKSLSASHNYNLVLNEPNACRTSGGNESKVFLLVCVFTIHENFEHRKAIRDTWGSQKLIKGKRIVTLFVLAKSSNPYHQKLLELESKKHGDIIMEDFEDSYFNLTLKTIMTMKWAGQYCSEVDYVMKTDDDMYINYDVLISLLTKPTTPTENYFVGNKFSGNAPIRNPKSKWYVPRRMYPNSRYPSFCSGTGYVMSGDIPQRAYNVSLRTRYLYLEDVYMGLCMKKLNVRMTGHPGFHIDNQPYKYCAYKRMITTHGKTITEMYRIWADQHSRVGTTCLGVKS